MKDENSAKDTHRHETFLTPEEWEQYDNLCKKTDASQGRNPRRQTQHLIRLFLKKHKGK